MPEMFDGRRGVPAAGRSTTAGILCGRVCRQALVDITYRLQSVPCKRASEYAGLVRLACWANLREAALAGWRWRWMWTNGMLHTRTERPAL